MRNVEKLIELERLERNALGRLIEACDLEAMQRAAFGFSSGGPLWGFDAAAAHSYMRMLQRASGVGGDEQTQGIFARSAPALSPAQLAEANRRGQQMFEQHCTQR